MNTEEFRKKKLVLQNKFAISLSKLEEDYAHANSTVKVGDLVRDHIGWIEVVKIEVTRGFSDELPSCLYWGRILTKKFDYTKKPIKGRGAYQSRIKEIRSC